MKIEVGECLMQHHSRYNNFQNLLLLIYLDCKSKILIFSLDASLNLGPRILKSHEKTLKGTHSLA